MMPDRAIPVQHDANDSRPTVMQSAMAEAGRLGSEWRRWSLPGLLWATARENALSYARQRAGYSPTEIQVLHEAWSVVATVANEDARPQV